MKNEEFRKHGYAVVDWIADYMEGIEQYPVMSPAKPGDIKGRIPLSPPERGEPMAAIFEDFKRTILPGMTHWQHPSFFGYFPANTSEPSILAEFLTAAMGAQCMIWQTSPAATELEEAVMDWLRRLLDLPPEFVGVIQDSASTSTLCALLCAREYATRFAVNRNGFAAAAAKGLLVYASEEAHSSVEKAAKIAGYGKDHLRLVPSGPDLAMRPEALEAAVKADKAAGLLPCCTVATVGTTSSTAIDPLKPIGEICRDNGLWFHVDAALAGTAAILPEMRHILDGVEMADSLVFNPHKWMFTNFDCSAYFCRDPRHLTATFEILPEYLKTNADQQVKNFRDWGIPLGRRFRALKLWFVMRHFGVSGLQEKVREHIRLARELESRVRNDPRFEVLAPVTMNLVCFRFRPGDRDYSEEELERLNKSLMDSLNESGRLFLTHTKLKGKFALRLCVGQTNTREAHVLRAWEMIRETAGKVV